MSLAKRDVIKSMCALSDNIYSKCCGRAIKFHFPVGRISMATIQWINSCWNWCPSHEKHMLVVNKARLFFIKKYLFQYVEKASFSNYIANWYIFLIDMTLLLQTCSSLTIEFINLIVREDFFLIDTLYEQKHWNVSKCLRQIS